MPTCYNGKTTMEREYFERLVAASVNALPREFQELLYNIEVVVEDRPTSAQLNEAVMEPGDSLLGLYEGVPLTERGSYYGMVLPDKISIFQRPIEDACRSDAEIRAEVRRVVLHEIAHYFGFDDERLDELGK